MLPLLCLLSFAALVLVFPSVWARAQPTDEERHIRDEYQGKTLVLRGFYAGDRLRYNSDGIAVGGATPSDWTIDGFVLVNDVQVSSQRLVIKGNRLLVVAGVGRGFGFYVENPKKRKKKLPSLEIDLDLGTVNSSAEHIDAAISKIFLTAQDTFADLVPDYWQPCVPAGLAGENTYCKFSSEFATIQGIAPQRQSDPTSGASANTQSKAVARPSSGVSPPVVIRQQPPDFNETARRLQIQGTMTLGMTIDRSGVPQNFHVLNPLGCGLDLEAVRAVGKWRFKPAEKDGQAVAEEIAVEVDFHLH